MKQTADKKTRDAFELPIIEVLRKIERLIIEKNEEVHQLRQKIKALKKQGTVNASLHYRASRYLYLIHPTDSNGNRKREYVGAEPQKIKEAQDKVNRFHQVIDLERKLAREESKLSHTENHLNNITRTLQMDW